MSSHKTDWILSELPLLALFCLLYCKLSSVVNVLEGECLSLCEISINVSKLLAVLLLPVYLFIRFLLYCTLLLSVYFLIPFLYWCYCYIFGYSLTFACSVLPFIYCRVSTLIPGQKSTKIRKVFLRRFPLSRFLAEILRVTEIAMKSFSKNLSFGADFKL